MKRNLYMSNVLCTATQDFPILQDPEPCPACQKYGLVQDCESQDLSAVKYLNLASALTNSSEAVIDIYCDPAEELLLWHANWISVNPALLSRLIDSILIYVDKYSYQHCVDNIKFLISIHDVHVFREHTFILNIIKNLKDGNDDIMLKLLRKNQSPNIPSVENILMNNIKYSRLFSLLSMMFFEEVFDDENDHASNVESNPAPLTRQNAMIGFDVEPSSPIQTHPTLVKRFRSLSIASLVNPEPSTDDEFSIKKW